MNSSLNCAGFLADLVWALQTVVCEGPQFSLSRVIKDQRVYLIGNGGSAAVAAHIANDFIKAGLRAHALTDPAVMTCMANDYGYDRVFSEQLKRHLERRDWVIAISSSGKSRNIHEAVQLAKVYGAKVVTLSGFDADNPLRSMGDTNYWLPSHNYGIVEIVHLAILHGIVNPGETSAA